MKIISILLIQLLFFLFLGFGQTKVLKGKIIDKFGFQPIVGVNIVYSDTTVFTTTDFQKGEFEIQLPDSINSLLIRALGYEQKLIFLNDGCNQLDIILEQRPTNCFMSLEESDKSRLKEFKKLPKLHKEAYDKGFLKTEQPCYKQKFMADTKWKRFQKII